MELEKFDNAGQSRGCGDATQSS